VSGLPDPSISEEGHHSLACFQQRTPYRGWISIHHILTSGQMANLCTRIREGGAKERQAKGWGAGSREWSAGRGKTRAVKEVASTIKLSKMSIEGVCIRLFV
jgi:hypothetical protein